MLGHVKRSLDGTGHAIKHAKYARRYLAEAMWRFHRRFNLAGMLKALLDNRAGPVSLDSFSRSPSDISALQLLV